MEFIVRMYAMRLAKKGICVNAVSPAYTDTAEWDKARLAMGQVCSPCDLFSTL